MTFEADSPYAGTITVYDSPIFIADAAMYLMAHNPDLGITDPYELTQEQFDAAVELLKQQAANVVRRYWALYTDEIDGFVDGSMVVGHGVAGQPQPRRARRAGRRRDPVRRASRAGPTRG